MGNPSFNFTVQFISRFQENTTVTWRKDNIFLPEQRVRTSYTSEINGVTMVNFPTISRSDAGHYQVIIKNVIPTTSMTAVGAYQLQVVGKIYFSLSCLHFIQDIYIPYFRFSWFSPAKLYTIAFERNSCNLCRITCL